MTGRNLVVEFAAGCGDLVLATAPFKVFGSINTKQLDFTGSTTDNNSDLSEGVMSQLVTTLSAELTVSGWADKQDTALVSNQLELTQYFINEVLNGRQPSGWLHVYAVGYAIEYYVFVNITQGPGLGGGTNDTVTFSMTFSSTATGFNGVDAIQIVDAANPPEPDLGQFSFLEQFTMG